MASYELAILGKATAAERKRLTSTIADMVKPFGLDVGSDVAIHDAGTLGRRANQSSAAACYFAGNVNTDVAAAQKLVDASIPVIPTIPSSGDFRAGIPVFLQHFNGHRRRNDDRPMAELATAMLECVGLLRRQRRVFVSYRRLESRRAAQQLHDLLGARGFDVFLDTHDIRPGDTFQDVLWQRLCDSDVMVMLDTPTYFESKWTRHEIGRARAKEIHVLRVVWPEHTSNKLTDLAETIYLERDELEGPDGPLAAPTADQIVLAVERLRSRSIASRYMTITGKLRVSLKAVGATVEGVGAHRSIAARLLDGAKIWAYPVVGVPSAETLHDVAEKARRADQDGMPILVYDHLGIGESWSAHLRWLDDHIRSVRAIKVHEAGWMLAALEP